MSRHSSFLTTARVRVPAVVAAFTLASTTLSAQPPALAERAITSDVSSVPDTPRAVPAPTPTPTPVGPTRDAAAVAARPARTTQAVSTADASAALAPTRTHHGPAVALMVVGASAVVLGLLVGGDSQTPLVVGGAVVGLIGLYQYLL
jgi:hypothetical protein